MTRPPAPGTFEAFAWERITDQLSDRNWVTRTALVATVTKHAHLSGDLAEKLIAQGIRLGHLEVRNFKQQGHTRQELRLAGAYREPGGAIYIPPSQELIKARMITRRKETRS